MRLYSLQENLKKGLNIVGHITSKNINLPILNNVLIKAIDGKIELISTNLEIGIIRQVRGKVENEGQFTVDSKLISEYINLLNTGEKVKIEEKGGELKVECGNYKTKIKGEEAKDFPLIPSINKKDGFTCSVVDFRRALNSVAFSVSNSENRLELTGILFSLSKNKLTMVATDSYRLAEKELLVDVIGSPEEQKHIIPSRTAQELLRVLNNLNDSDIEGEERVSCYFSDNQVLFSVDSVDLISRLINGNYPDYKQIIPNSKETQVLVDRQELIRAVKAAALFSKTGVNDVTLVFTKDKITVSAFSGSSGESQVELEVETDGKDNEVTINHRYLLDGLNNIDSQIVSIHILNNNSPCLIQSDRSDNYLYIVMPIRQ